MNMLHHGINLNVHEVLDVNMRRQDNGVIIMTIRHKVLDCTENTYGVAAYEMVLFPAEGGILVAPVIDTAKRVA